MATNPAETSPEPTPYQESSVAMRTDHSGNDIVVRPRQFLASGDPAAVEAAVTDIAEDVLGYSPEGPVVSYEPADGKDQRRPKRVRGSWTKYVIQVDVDELRVVRGLRDRGIPAQPNHVYFVNSRSNRMQGQFNPNLFAPNLFAPNLFAPNLFAPNLFAPNLFAPNLFAPNLFAPNLFAPNLFAGGGGEAACCCPGGLSDGETLGTPPLAARPVDDPCSPCGGKVENATKGSRVEIHVIDVANPSATTPTDNMTGEYNDPDKKFIDGVDHNQDGWADPAIAHGAFVQSVVELNSGITTQLWAASDPLGDIDDVHVVDALRDVAAASDPDKLRIVNLSLSGYNEDDRPSTILADEIADMIKKGWIVVASAGNNASCRLAWPAALPGVIAVGAVGAHGPAWFSNHGSWIDASAHGVDVVARFPKLNAPGLPERLVARTADGGEITTFAFSTGWARWSGTSFSAPLVTARLARRIEDGLTADEAIALVIDDPGLPRIPDYGTLVR